MFLQMRENDLKEHSSLVQMYSHKEFDSPVCWQLRVNVDPESFTDKKKLDELSLIKRKALRSKSLWVILALAF